MQTRSWTFICAAAALAASVALFIWYEQQPTEVLRSELARARVSGTVMVAGTPYSVRSGAVSGSGAVSAQQAYAARKTMYALALADRSPLLGLAGVDPDALASSTTALSNLRRQLISFQRTQEKAELVEGLYPIGFLRALADAEKARHAFIASGSDTDRAAYTLAVGNAAQEGLTDIRAFQKGLDQVIGTTTVRIGSAAGTETDASLRATVITILNRMNEVLGELQVREQCIQGLSRACDRDLRADSPPSVPAPSDQNRAALAQRVLAIYRDAVAPLPNEDRTITLSESTCFGATPGPYPFQWLAPAHQGVAPFRFIGDIFLAPTANATDEMLSYFRTTRGMSYSPLNPFSYYTCPAIGDDLARLLTVRSIESFAIAHPEIDVPLRSTVVGLNVSESDAYAYLAQAQESRALTAPSRRALEELILMANERTAGLDTVVGSIARTMSKDISDSNGGIPIEFFRNVRELYIAESAFPTLYLAQSPAAGSERMSLYNINAQDQAAFERRFIPYSKLESSVSRAVIVHDIGSFVGFEGAGIGPLP